MVRMVKSSLLVGVQPSGSAIAEMWRDSLKSILPTSAVIPSGMLSAGTIISTVCSTMLIEPPRLRPGQMSMLEKCTGTSTLSREPALRRRKSTCKGVSLITSSW